MDSGRCRHCGRAFTSGEIAGVGILRARPAHLGGPLVEFACPACKTVIPLVPFGNGRYALPGQAPPPPPTSEERTIPWRRPDPGEPNRSGAPPPSATARTPHGPPAVPTSPPPAPAPAPAPAKPTPSDAPLTALSACDLLGLAPTAGDADVERAFRERALLCHPDKVAHLDADFVVLAERKFRRLQEARDLLLEVVKRSEAPPRG